MALTDYANLKSAVARFAGRDDLDSLMPDFIEITEDYIYNNESRPLRLQSMEQVTTLSTTAGANSLALPERFLSLRSISIETGGSEYELTYQSPSAIDKLSEGGVPTAYTIEAGNIVFNVPPDGVYDVNLVFYQKPVPITPTSSTNDILTNNPTIYLHGCLSCVFEYTGELERAENYYQKMIRSIKGATANDNKGRYSNAAAKVRSSTP